MLTIGELMNVRSKFADVDAAVDGLNEARFVAVLREVLKTEEHDAKALLIFRKLSVSEDVASPTISWNPLLDHLIKHLSDRKESKLIRMFPSLDLDHNYLLLTHNRRESTAKVTTIMASSLIYVFVSKLGVIGILDQNLKLQNTYSVDLDDFSNKEPSKNRLKRISQAWATDATHMADCKKLVIGSTKRTLHFFDISAAAHIEEFRLFGLTNSATCFAYWFNAKEEEKGSVLFYGDDAGDVHRLHFLRPQTLLFKKKDLAEGLVRVFFKNLEEHNEYVVHSKIDIGHGDKAPVTRIHYVEENQCIITISDGESSPLLITHVDGKLPRYVFRNNKGIKCFDFNRPLNLLVTGSRDCLVRYWNPYVTSAPSASLKGHQMTVLDTRISYDTCVVISYSIDMVIMIWDIEERLCLQTLPLHFPVPAKLPSAGLDWDHGQWPLHVETFKSTSVLVTCKNYVTKLKLIKTKTRKWQIASTAAMASSDGAKSKIKSRPPKSERKPSPSIVKHVAVEDSHRVISPNRRRVLRPSTATATSKSETCASILKLPSYAKPKETKESLDEFGNYIFYKLRQFDGHLSRKEIESMTRRGMPTRALKIQDPTPVVLPFALDLPSQILNRPKCRRPSYRKDIPLIIDDPNRAFRRTRVHFPDVLSVAFNGRGSPSLSVASHDLEM